MAASRGVVGAVIAGLALLPSMGCGSVGGNPSSRSNASRGASGSSSQSAAGDAGVAHGIADAGASASDQSLADEIAAIAEQSTGQVFIALLRPLNSGVNGRPARAIAALSIDGDALDVVVLAKGLAPDMEHMQHIHGVIPTVLAACPPAAADVNHDGIIDVLEGVPSYGPILVPLDSNLDDLNPQTFPTASPEGILRYEQKGSVSAIEHNLGAPLDLETRVIALHGVAPNTPLPPTVETLPGLAPSFTLPVACGELVRVK